MTEKQGFPRHDFLTRNRRSTTLIYVTGAPQAVSKTRDHERPPLRSVACRRRDRSARLRRAPRSLVRRGVDRIPRSSRDARCLSASSASGSEARQVERGGSRLKPIVALTITSAARGCVRRRVPASSHRREQLADMEYYQPISQSAPRARYGILIG